MIVVTAGGTLEVPEPRTPARANAATQFAFEWTGTDGATWDLLRGPAFILSGARGFGMPTPEHWRRAGLGHGSRHNGLRIPDRQVYMPVEVEARDWLPADRDFFAGMDPRSTGSLRVTTPQGEWREIVLRYDEGAEGEYELDPLLRKRAVYPIRLTAEDPFWRGTPVVKGFKTRTDVAPRDTFPPAGTPPSLYFRRSDTLDGEGEITNPGDVDAYAVWKVTAPFSGFSVGIGDQFVDMTLTKSTGYVTIDTTGGLTTMRDESGASVRSFADDFNSPPIPPGDTTLRLQVTNPGAGSEVEVSFQPRYFRAW